MKTIAYNPEKRKLLIKERGIDLLEIIYIIETKNYIGILEHPTRKHQKLELMRELAQGERTPIKDLNSEKKRYARYAKNTIEKANKRKAISIRIFEEDLIKIKAKAQDLGIPYQTYISSELRKLVA